MTLKHANVNARYDSLHHTQIQDHRYGNACEFQGCGEVDICDDRFCLQFEAKSRVSLAGGISYYSPHPRNLLLSLTSLCICVSVGNEVAPQTTMSTKPQPCNRISRRRLIEVCSIRPITASHVSASNPSRTDAPFAQEPYDQYPQYSPDAGQLLQCSRFPHWSLQRTTHLAEYQ